MKIYFILSCMVFSLISTAQNVGIGNQNPTEKLDVTGNIKADTIKTAVIKIAANAGPGKVLTSNAAGVGSWQNSSGSNKVNNGLTTNNDTIKLGGLLADEITELKLAGNELSFRDIGTATMVLATSSPAASNIVLSATPVTQTFIPAVSARLTEVQLNITALNGAGILVQLKNREGIILASVSKNYTVLTNGADPFILTSYLDKTETYTLSVTGNSSAFLNYDLSSNSYPNGTSSLGANADLSFSILGTGEENLLTLKNNKIGIGTNAPTQKLEVNGNIQASGIIASNSFQLTNGASAGRVLTSDVSGNGFWSNGNTVPGTISSTSTFYGSAGTVLPSAVGTWEFFGPTTTVVLNGNQRLVVDIVAALGKNGAGINSFRLDIGYQLQPSGSVLNAAGGNYAVYQPNFVTGTDRLSWKMAASFKPAAGTYKIGCAIYCGIAGYLNYNDFVNGYYMIINE